jgi:hypothetical protein
MFRWTDDGLARIASVFLYASAMILPAASSTVSPPRQCPHIFCAAAVQRIASASRLAPRSTKARASESGGDSLISQPRPFPARCFGIDLSCSQSLSFRIPSSHASSLAGCASKLWIDHRKCSLVAARMARHFPCNEHREQPRASFSGFGFGSCCIEFRASIQGASPKSALSEFQAQPSARIRGGTLALSARHPHG